MDTTTALTLILAALAVLLTALAIMIAIAAIWGYTGIKDEARKIASRTAEKSIAEYLEKQAVKDKLREAVLPRQIARNEQGVSAVPYKGEEDESHANNDKGTA